MTGRIKLVDENGNVLYPNDDEPVIPYGYESPSEYDEECGTYGLEDFTLPNSQCPSQFVCGKPEGPVGAYANCVDSMNCAMIAGMTSNVHMNSAIALFSHQMIPHHQNAVNMCKALFKSGEIECEDIEDEEDPHCAITHLCYEIINGQNFEIQTMKGILDSLGHDEEDDCVVNVDSKATKVNVDSKTPKTQKSPRSLRNKKRQSSSLKNIRGARKMTRRSLFQK